MIPLTFHNFALDKGGQTASFALQQGESLIVLGPAASGKSRLLNVCVGTETPVRGTLRVSGDVSLASLPGGRRLRPQSIAQLAKGASMATRASEALSATHLWDFRQSLLVDLSPSQLAACELLVPLASSAQVLVIDGLMDQLDPWVMVDILSLLRRRMADGACVVLATNRLELIPEFDHAVLLKASQIRYSGRVWNLTKAATETIVVETANQAAVKAVGPTFEVSAEETEDGLILRAGDGQALAARLLLEGYGDIKSVLVKKSHPAEEIMRLIDGR